MLEVRTQPEQSEKRSRLGRPTRYGQSVVDGKLTVYFPPALLDLIVDKANQRRLAEPKAGWSASSYVMKEMARALNFDLNASVDSD